MRGGSRRVLALLAAGFLLGAIAAVALTVAAPNETAPAVIAMSQPSPAPTTPPAVEATASPTAEPTTRPDGETPARLARADAWVDPASVGQPYSDTVAGVLTFRGNPTRTYYGRGPVPMEDPGVAWRYPERGALCGESTVGSETREWCGTGWTGQPAVFERDGRTWVVFGAYDHQVHFLDADTGGAILPPFRTGDLAKGSVTVDPDGYPLVYAGSRDDHYRVLAIDGDEPEELWSLWAHDTSPTLWNSDWDGAGLVIDDHLLIGGENSRFHIVRLHRGYDADGRVTVDPELIFDAAGWDEELLAALGDHMVSIEGSVAVWENIVYFANSGGLVQGWDIAGLRDGRVPHRVFRFWTGDDTDATVVVDTDGMLYVASEWKRRTARGREVGQIMKLDPHPSIAAARADLTPDADPPVPDPLVWSVHDRDGERAGVWATPALHRDVLYVPTDGGELLAIDREHGEVRWRIQLTGPTWSSPVVVDDVLIQGDCSGTLRAYDVRDTDVEPAELWALPIGGCIESTPTVWDGRIYVGTRAGWFVAVGEGGHR